MVAKSCAIVTNDGTVKWSGAAVVFDSGTLWCSSAPMAASQLRAMLLDGGKSCAIVINYD